MAKVPPFFSIITATYNAGDTLSATLVSLEAQTFRDFEFIVVDGNSDDDTLAIIKKNYPNVIQKYISENDNGIYDAWNKGLSLAEGSWISFLGAGDEYYPNALEEYHKFIGSNPDANLDFISSKVHVINSTGKILFDLGRSWSWPRFKKKMTVAHVGAIHSKAFYSKYGKYDNSYKIVGDYEILLRAKHKLKTGYFNEFTARMIYGGKSFISISSLDYYEQYRILTETLQIPKWRAYLHYRVSHIKGIVQYFLRRNNIFIVIKK